MAPHAPPDLLRPPDPAQNNPLSSIYISTEPNPQQQTTAAAIFEERVDGTVKRVASESPHRRTQGSGQNRDKINRPIDSRSQKTHTPQNSGHSNHPIMSSDPAIISGEHLNGQSGILPVKLTPDDHQNQPTTSNDPLTLTTVNLDLPCNIPVSNTQEEINPTQSPVCINANETLRQYDAPIGKFPIHAKSVDELRAQMACYRSGNGNAVTPRTTNFDEQAQTDHSIANATIPNCQVHDGTKHVSTVGDKRETKTAPPPDKGSDPLPKEHFPPLRRIKISSNFDKMESSKVHNNSVIKDTTGQNVQPVVIPHKNNPDNKHVTVSTLAPQPPKVIPSYATRLRAAQIHEEHKIDLSAPIITTKQGLPAVLFKREDFMVKLAEKCKYTVIGKFSNSMPKMEVIRKSLTSQLQIKGTCKVTHFNSKHVYIDLDNEIDHTTVWNKEKIWVEGMVMRLFVWTPTFKPQEETPVAPVWVILPELPWHCYKLEFVAKLLAPIGRVLFFDAASLQKTRGSVAKVKIEIDITKPRVHHVWLGFPEEEDDVFGDGKWQELQFENVPEYCQYCRHQGHTDHACILKRREEDQARRKEEQTEKKKKQAENPDLKMQGTTQDSSKQVPEETSKQPVQGQNQWQTQKRKGARVTNNQENTKRQAEEDQKHGDTKRNAQKVKQVYQPRQGQDRSNATEIMQPNVLAKYPLTSEKETDAGITVTQARFKGIQHARDTNFGNVAQAGVQPPVIPTTYLPSVALSQAGLMSGNGCLNDLNCNNVFDALVDLEAVNHATSDPLRLIDMIGKDTIKQNAVVVSTLSEKQGKMPVAYAAVNDTPSLEVLLPEKESPLRNTINERHNSSVVEVQNAGHVAACSTDVMNGSTAKKESSKSFGNVEADGNHTIPVAGSSKEWILESFYGIGQEVDTSVKCCPNNAKSHNLQTAGNEMHAHNSALDDGKQFLAVNESLAIVSEHQDTVNQKKKNAAKASLLLPVAGHTVENKHTSQGGTSGGKLGKHSSTTCGKNKKKTGKKTGKSRQQTEEEILKAEKMAFWDAILAKSYAENPVIESNIEPLNVRKNKATVSIHSQDNIDPANIMPLGSDNDEIESNKAFTEEEIRKAKIRNWQDAILAKSYAENPIIESKESLNVLENKATQSVPSQDSFEPTNAITLGRDNDDIENDRALIAYVSPAHSGNKLIPTARLEVMCKQASKAMKEVGRGFFPVTPQAQIDTEAQEAPTYFLGNLFEDSHKDQNEPSKDGKSKWNLNAPLFIPNALCQQESQEATESVDTQKIPTLVFPNAPSDEVLLRNLDLHDIRGLLQRQNSPPQELPPKFSSTHPGIIEDGSEYEDEDEESTAYNYMEESRHAGLSPRLDQIRKPKLIKKKRRPLELKKKEEAPKKPKRVQPTRSSKSKSARAK